ncbi:MAG TPA: hypothetical protein VLF93_02510 [Candidatus Saccharimonadales bacterium]|nr:hypothetical protein [Candidatus Saccharimonadales bacterium]
MKINITLVKQMLLGVFAAIAVTFFVFPASAHAQQQICGNNGTGYCLNDWNGNINDGAAVKMFNGGNSHENFFIQFIPNMCNNGNATSTCPINVHGVNLSGFPIVEIRYGADSCLGTNSSGQAVLGACPDGSGNNGSNGTIFVWWDTGTMTGPCALSTGSQFTGYLANRYWTNNDGQLEDLFSGGNPGVQAFFGGGNGTCWGGL